MRPALLAAALVFASVGCVPFVPAGDSAINAFVFNRSSNDFTIRIGPDGYSSCRELAAGRGGRIYGQLGSLTYAPVVRLYDASGHFVTDLRASTDQTLFIVENGGTVEALEVAYSGTGPPLLIEAPGIPEVDGYGVPDDLPEKVCGRLD